MGPFYCPGVQKVYIDLTLCDALQQPSRGMVRPQRFTHGRRAQPVSGFKWGTAVVAGWGGKGASQVPGLAGVFRPLAAAW